MAEELKACPLQFCGGPVQFHKDDDCAGCHLIECQSCKTTFDLATKADPENQADSLEELQMGIAHLWNRRAKLPSQGGEAVEVVTTWHPDSRSYEEQIVKHDTKGSRKSLGAMNAKLRAKVGRLERELETVKKSLTVEPVAYAAFAENGNIRMWCRSAIGMCELFDAHGNKAVPLYTAPPSPDAELVELLRSKFPRIDPCQPVPLDEKAHCCEYTIYVERERLHRIIDAKLASLKGVEE